MTARIGESVTWLPKKWMARAWYPAGAVCRRLTPTWNVTVSRDSELRVLLLQSETHIWSHFDWKRRIRNYPIFYHVQIIYCPPPSHKTLVLENSILVWCLIISLVTYALCVVFVLLCSPGDLPVLCTICQGNDVRWPQIFVMKHH
jgi:hypothetical protein